MLVVRPKPPVQFVSIISAIFDGKILSSVQCLTCERVRVDQLGTTRVLYHITPLHSIFRVSRVRVRLVWLEIQFTVGVSVSILKLTQ